MPSIQTSGTQTATLDTEHTLATITDAGVYYLEVDCGAMVLLDRTILKVKEKTLSGGTTRILDVATYSNVQGDPIKRSAPIYVDQEIVVTLEQVDGTGRSYPWKVAQLDA